MINKRMRRIVGLLLIVDGLLVTLLGRPFVKLFRFGPRGSAYRRLMTWWSRRPAWLLRASGAIQAAAGAAVLNSAPLSVHEFYPTIAETHAKHDTAWRDWLHADAHAAFDRLMVQHLPPDGDILDLGCGTGANLTRLQQMGADIGTYTGVDISRPLLNQFAQKEDPGAIVHLEQLNLEADPLPEGPFDLIVCTWALEHLRYPAAVVQKAYAHLRPGGHMILLFGVNTGYWWGRLVNRILHFASARQLPEDLYFTFPGFHRIRTYRGALGDLALIVLRKPIAVS